MTRSRHVRPALLALCLLLPPVAAAAWEDHDQLTRLALEEEPYASLGVQAERLEDFLAAEAPGLAELLASVEARSLKELDFYRALPEGLAFDPEAAGALSGAGSEAAAAERAASLRGAFLRAIRVNPEAPLALFVQPLLGHPRARPELPVAAADPYANRFPNQPFEALEPGSLASALEVLATASDEPDYGLDIGLYEDNGSAAGSAYGLGRQPFGNPALPYGSQAPFHMAFPGEDPLIKLAAGWTRESLSAYRVLLYGELARFAFRTGHDYWGFRFAGWALHYVQDLAQPYHASLIPGRPALSILALNAFGSAEAKAAALVFLSNRHALVEDYQYRILAAGDAPAGASIRDALRGRAGEGSSGGPAGGAAAGGPAAARAGEGLPAWRRGYEYDVVAARARARGARLDEAVASSFPERYVADPSYDYGASNVGETREFDPLAHLSGKAEERALLESELAASLADAGAGARAFMAWLRSGEEAPARRRPFDARPLGYLAAPLALAGGLLFLLLRRRRRGARTGS